MDRFYQKTKRVPSGCLEWQAYRQRQGYGVFRLNGKVELAHRAAWMIENGAIPDGMQVNHRCDNSSCVDVGHLYIGTQKENVRDMISRGRDARPAGEDHYATTITKDEAVEIKRRLEIVPRHDNGRVKGGELLKIARDMGVSHRLVQMISCGDSWKHIK